MRILKFPQKELSELTDAEIDTVNNYKNTTSAKNGMVLSILKAYNNHKVLSISPDDVMNNICCLWAKYVFLNAEKFRSQIVTHKGQKTITILTQQNTRWDNELLIDHMSRYISEINGEQESIKWMDVEFTTTKELDKMIRQVAVLASQKAYYAYHSRTLCWLPQINIMGTVEDWELLWDKIKVMPCFDPDMEAWRTILKRVVSKFIVASEKDIDFWQAPLTYFPGGSGSINHYCGWITVFNPFNEKGMWGRKSVSKLGRSEEKTEFYFVPTEEILDLSVNFEIICENDYGDKIGSLKVAAGATAVQASKEFGIQPQNKLHFTYHNV